MTHEEATESLSPSAAETLAQQLEFPHVLRGRRLYEHAVRVDEENAELRKVVDELREHQEAMREKIEVLCAPEHYPVAITKVMLNGSCRVEVAGHGGVRTEVAVHPAVSPGELAVGRRAILAKARNCVLHVEDDSPDWRDVGEFEDWLDSPHRILVRQHEQLMGVTLAEELVGAELKKGDHIGFDRDTGIAYIRLDPPARESLFSDDIPTDDFSQLGGLDPQIAQVKQAIDFSVKHPEVAQRYGVRTKRGILLCGQPGNGKTRVGRCTAAYVSSLLPGTTCRFMSLVGASDIYSMWLGESERRLREMFAAAEEAAQSGPVVLFFDELDAVGRRRGSDRGSGAPDRILNTLLGLLDGIKKLSNVIVMGATNRGDTLDPALVRPGRFDLKIVVPSPNRRAAQAILRLYLQGLPLRSDCDGVDQLIDPLLSRIYSPNGEYAQLVAVKLSDGRNVRIAARELISGAMLESVSRLAAEQAAVREIQSGTPGGVTGDDLMAALDQELRGITALLTAANVQSYAASLPDDVHPVSVTSMYRSAHTLSHTR